MPPSRQTFTVRPSNERQLFGAEADQGPSSRECHMLTLSKGMFWQFGVGPAPPPKLMQPASANMAAPE
jgi:hypothetical protein